MWEFIFYLGSLFLTTLILSSSSNYDGQNQCQNFIDCLNLHGVDTSNFVPRSNISNGRYNELNQQWNILIPKKTPAGYFLVERSRDVQISVLCGKRLGIRVVPKCGGHGYGKYAYGDSYSIVLDLRRLNRITTDSSRMIGSVGAGAHLGGVAYQFWAQGEFMTPLGICPTVGVSGLGLGGGHGFFSRLYGLSTENVVELEFVNAEGELLVVNNRSNVDLYWALRGAGGSGSFGIVTNFKFQLYPVPQRIIHASVLYEFEKFPSSFNEWNKFMTGNPPGHFGSFYTVWDRVIEIILVDIQYGSDTQYGTSRIEAVLATFTTIPKSITITSRNYEDFITETSIEMGGFGGRFNNATFADLASLNYTDDRLVYHKSKSFYVQKNLDLEEIQTLYELFDDVSRAGAYFFFEGYGGAINHLSPSDTAFVHRGPDTYYQLCIAFKNKINSNEALFALEDFFEKSKAVLGHKQSYQNYVDPVLGDYLQRYYGTNLDRLIQIKNQVDPDNYFHGPQSIPLALP